MENTSEKDASAPLRRPRGTREGTENELIDAVLRLLQRDGVLAGVTLREVAKEAGVNHGQIYHYFGTRRGLLRAAIARMLEENRPVPEEHWDRPFADRRRAMWQIALSKREFVSFRRSSRSTRILIFRSSRSRRDPRCARTRQGDRRNPSRCGR